MNGEPEVFQGPRGFYFPVVVESAETGRRDGIPWLAVEMEVGNNEVGVIPWTVVRCLN